MEKHYICLGGCKGVSEVPGVCGAETCADHNHDLKECNCTDSSHNDFKACENCGENCGGACQTA
ncbi:MAG: hypothetical protein QG566_175 [Patescibacteria group bacterium]|nr:hypothetical protein [Patescibacteria group bacterium]